MFILKPDTSFTARHRTSNTVTEKVAQAIFVPNGASVNGFSGHTVKTGGVSEIYDSDTKEDYRMKPVWHRKTVYLPHTVSGFTSASLPCWQLQLTDWAPPIPDLPSFDTIVEHPAVQSAISTVVQRWYNDLYRMDPDNLPDMTVFLAELREFGGFWTTIYSYALQIIGVLRKMRLWKRRLKRAKRLDAKKIAKRTVRDANRALTRLSSDLLSLRFGIMAPIRDCTEIIAALYGYMDRFQGLYQHNTYREIVRIPFYAKEHGIDPSSIACLNTMPCWNQCEGGFQNTHELTGEWEVTICITSHYTCSLRGSQFEAALAMLLGQLGMMPSLDSFWELTRLSWLVDYFFRTNLLLNKVERLGDLGNKRVFIHDSCVSLKIKRTAVVEGFDGYTGINATGAYNKVVDTYYERVVADGHDLAKLCSMFTTPYGQKAQNALAFLIQRLL